MIKGGVPRGATQAPGACALTHPLALGSTTRSSFRGEGDLIDRPTAESLRYLALGIRLACPNVSCPHFSIVAIDQSFLGSVYSRKALDDPGKGESWRSPRTRSRSSSKREVTQTKRLKQSMELPDQVDTEQDAGLLDKFGVDPQELISKFGAGLGGVL
jgi:hypothetical protein